MIYIGSSGKIKQNGTIKIRKGGMFDKPRKTSWKEKLISEKIEALDIYWYETFNQNHTDLPSTIEGIIIQRHFNIFGTLPK